MTDWTKDFQADYEFFELDYRTWSESGVIHGVSDCEISRKASDRTLETCRLKTSEPISERWFRVYLKATQRGATEHHALGTFVAKSCRKRFGGSAGVYYEVDAYSPLKCLDVSQVEPGFVADLSGGALKAARELAAAHCPAPCAWSDDGTAGESYAANPDDLSALTLFEALLSLEGCKPGLDEHGNILAVPMQDPHSLARAWTFTTERGDTVIYPELPDDGDLCDVPNCVRVVYERPNANPIVGYAENDDSASDVSTVRRGYRQFGDASGAVLPDDATQADVDAAARRLLREQSATAHSVKVSHGYCGIRLHDGVGFEHPAAGLENVTAEVVETRVSCTPECRCETVAEYTERLWEGA